MAQWTVSLERIEVLLPVGIYEHEKNPQRIWVDAEVEFASDSVPERIEQCFNYELAYNHVTQQWPARGHTELLETLAHDLLRFICQSEPRADRVRVMLSKPDVFPHAQAAKVSLEWKSGDAL